MLKVKEESLPGVVLGVVESELLRGSGRVVLSAEVSDLDVWDRVIENLDGMPIYTVRDVPQLVAATAQKRADHLKSTVEYERRQYASALEQIKSELSFAQKDRDSYKRQLDAAMGELVELRRENSDLHDVCKRLEELLAAP